VKPEQILRPRHLDHLSDDKRGYPVISTIWRDDDGPDFGSINERRKLALATFDWCSVCGLPFGHEARWQVVAGGAPTLAGDQLEEAFFSEAPAHEICIVYAAHVCPHLSSPRHRMGDEYRAGQRRDSAIRVAGFARTSKVLALRSGLQNETYVQHFCQAGFLGEFSYSSPDELGDRYAALLSDETIPELSQAESGLVELFNEHSDVGDLVAGAALVAGAIFAKDVHKIQNMDAFTASGYRRSLAMHLLDREKLTEFGKDVEDRSFELMSEWLLERWGDLPEVIAGWRQAGLRLARSKGIATPRHELEGPGRTVGKNDPCPCGSGRKARRCHPAGLQT
jgi:hypothetical protein